MSVIIFTGPSLSAEEGRTLLEADFLPPAAQGDLYAATLEAPRAIGLIDGYFDRVPAVWHKEVLWALSHGIVVFGAASMGALRAAELHGFGMVGVGAVFEAFRDGTLEDDDEVAVVHAPPELRYLACSEAMVNIRATLNAAVRDDVVTLDTAGRLLGIAKDLHYPERDWPRVCALGRSVGCRGGEIDALEAWLPAGRIDLKRRDARAMLAEMERWLTEGGKAPEASFTFEYTDKWGELVVRTAAAAPEEPATAILEELKREPERYRRLHDAAVHRALARFETQRRGVHPAPEQIDRAAEAFMQQRGLSDAGRLDAWLAENRIGLTGFHALLEGDVRQRWFATMTERMAQAEMLDLLRMEGSYPELLARARSRAEAGDRAS